MSNRERAVLCRVCCERKTWNDNAVCEACTNQPQEKGTVP